MHVHVHGVEEDRGGVIHGEGFIGKKEARGDMHVHVHGVEEGRGGVIHGEGGWRGFYRQEMGKGR